MGEICNTCGLPKELCSCDQVAREQQKVTVYVVKRTYGKMVTIIDGLDQTSVNLEQIASELKTKLGCGGTVKNGKIELQGDHKRKVNDKLLELGFSAGSVTLKGRTHEKNTKKPGKA